MPAADPPPNPTPDPAGPAAGRGDDPLPTPDWATVAAPVDVENLSRMGAAAAGAAAPPPDPLPGYEFTEPLGAGGQGQVWLARDARSGGFVAVKYLLPSGQRWNDLHRARGLAREAAALSRVRHPNLVRLLGYADRPYPHLVLEYCLGGSLAGRVGRGRAPLPGPVAAATVERLGRAVDALNAAGFVHRDLKPANVLLRDDGQPAVADLGLARAVGDAAAAAPPPAADPTAWDEVGTRTGQFMGTPGFAPPEFEGGVNRAGPPADVYSLGAVLYQSLTGRPPFTGTTVGEVMYRTRTEPVRPVRDLNPDAPADLEAVCLKCLAKDPADRYPTAAALADDLERFRAGRPVAAGPPAGLGGRVRRAARAVFRRAETVADPATLFRTTFGMRPQEVAARIEEMTALTEFRRADPGRAAGMPPPVDFTQGFPADAPPGPPTDDGRAAGPPPLPPTARGGGAGGDPPADRPSCLGALNPLAWVRRAADRVECSVFAPPAVAAGDPFRVQVYAHRPGRTAEAAAFARAADRGAAGHGFVALPVRVRRGTRLAVHLDLPGFTVVDPWQAAVWEGDTTPVHFLVVAPPDLPPGKRLGTARVCLGGAPYGHLKFVLDVVPPGAAPPPRAEPVGLDARRYQRVFVSYATPDRTEVLKRVQMLRLLKARVFLDVLSLEPGDRWERGLYKHIETADLFLLFWSTAARESEWVRKELRYALGRKGGAELEPPEILPVLLEKPPPKAPTEIGDRHFNDRLLYFMSTAGR